MITLQALPLETIGAIKTSWSFTNSGKRKGSPAPEIIASTLLSNAALINSS